ncbi:protein SPATA31F3 isoform X1 [Ochotona princeps]|uniref:protein SPATA31F3 isoform X1 n=1 Tax=Ochotona princeps TaxID=9978 RepID=UPI00271478F3|nr:protein SPATA31F3 isoform X1 [Ochotona princeps]
MMSPTLILWDIRYPFYACGSIFIIGLIIWRVKKKRQKLRLGPHRSCCLNHQRIKQRPKDKAKAKKTSQEEAEKLQKLISVMKSQGWNPKEQSVRRLLCADPCCPVCNAVALEIHHLLECGNKQVPPTHSVPSQGSSHLEMVSTSSASFDQSRDLYSEHSGQSSMPPDPTRSRIVDQKCLTKSVSRLTGTVSNQDHCVEHCKHGKGFQVPDVSRDAGALSSSSLDEPGVSAKKQERKNRVTTVLEKKEAPEVDLENKMTLFSHWINPEVKGHKHEEPTSPFKIETTKTKTKRVEKSPVFTKKLLKGSNLEKTTVCRESQHPHAKKEGLRPDAPAAHKISFSNFPLRSVHPVTCIIPNDAPKSVPN